MLPVEPPYLSWTCRLDELLPVEPPCAPAGIFSGNQQLTTGDL